MCRNNLTVLVIDRVFVYFLYLTDGISCYQINHPKELSYEIYTH